MTKSLITLLSIYEQSTKPQDQLLPLFKTVLFQYLSDSVWHLTFALEIQENSMFWIHRYRALGYIQVFLEHSIHLALLTISNLIIHILLAL